MDAFLEAVTALMMPIQILLWTAAIATPIGLLMAAYIAAVE